MFRECKLSQSSTYFMLVLNNNNNYSAVMQTHITHPRIIRINTTSRLPPVCLTGHYKPLLCHACTWVVLPPLWKICQVPWLRLAPSTHVLLRSPVCVCLSVCVISPKRKFVNSSQMELNELNANERRISMALRELGVCVLPSDRNTQAKSEEGFPKVPNWPIKPTKDSINKMEETGVETLGGLGLLYGAGTGPTNNNPLSSHTRTHFQETDRF